MSEIVAKMSNITFINANAKEIKKSVPEKSKQQDSKDRSADRISPNDEFSKLVLASRASYIVGWLITKIKNSVLSGWSCDNEKILKVINETNRSTIVRNLLVCGNSWVEIIRAWNGEIADLIPVTISASIKVLKWWWGYVQQVNAKDTYFNTFTPIKDRAARITLRQTTGAKADQLVLNNNNKCGYNPNLNELYQFKLDSIYSSYYGDSFFLPAVTQIALLANIDTYYEKFFDNATVTNFLLSSDWEPLSEEEKQALQTFIKTDMKWLENAFTTAIVNTKLKKVSLGTDIDTKSFLEYRQKLEQSIALALNVPYDLVVSTSSNKASSATAIEQFNRYTIAPIQDHIVNGVRQIFSEMTGSETIKLVYLDTKDEKVEMETLTGYVNAKVMTRNEVRKKLWLDPIEWWDVFPSDQATPALPTDPSTITKSQEDLYSSIRKINEQVWQYYGWCNHSAWVCGHAH